MKRKTRVYYNSDKDTWSADDREKFVPVNMMLSESSVSADVSADASVSDVGLRIRKDDIERKKKMEVAQRKHILHMQKEASDGKLSKIVSRGLGKNVNVKKGSINNRDELYDDSIMPGSEYEKDVIEDYSDVFYERLRPNRDVNKDGVINEADVEVTSGSKTMESYL